MDLLISILKTLRNFELELVRPGNYIVAGGVAYNNDFVVKITTKV